VVNWEEVKEVMEQEVIVCFVNEAAMLEQCSALFQRHWSLNTVTTRMFLEKPAQWTSALDQLTGPAHWSNQLTGATSSLD